MTCVFRSSEASYNEKKSLTVLALFARIKGLKKRFFRKFS